MSNIKPCLLLTILLSLAVDLCFAVDSDSTTKPSSMDQEAKSLAELREKMKAIRTLSRTDLKAACEQEVEVINQLWTNNPAHPYLDDYLYDHLYRLGELSLEAAERTANRFMNSENSDVRRIVRGWQAVHQIREVPLELEFTAIDGREVDLKALRDKIVLVEFTGVTWCPACRIAEKELKKLYETYHEQGLEIISITYENSPEDRDTVAELIQDRDLPWPFSFDGLKNESPLISRFGIRAYPTTLVLDRSGRLFAYNPEVEELEQVVVKALTE